MGPPAIRSRRRRRQGQSWCMLARRSSPWPRRPPSKLVECDWQKISWILFDVADGAYLQSLDPEVLPMLPAQPSPCAYSPRKPRLLLGDGWAVLGSVAGATLMARFEMGWTARIAGAEDSALIAPEYSNMAVGWGWQ